MVYSKYCSESAQCINNTLNDAAVFNPLATSMSPVPIPVPLPSDKYLYISVSQANPRSKCKQMTDVP